LFFIDDIMNCSKVLHFILFADDTNIFATDKSLDNMITTVNFELKKLATWFRANKLSLIIKKSNFIIFQGRGHQMTQNNIQVRIDDNLFERVDSCKFLGLIIDRYLSWKLYIVSVANTVARNIGVFFLCS